MQKIIRSHGGESLSRAVEELYREGQNDYSLEPLVRVKPDGLPVGLIKEGDSVVFCCRRGEREIELTEAFTDPEFSHFDRSQLENLFFVPLTLYHEKFKDLPVAFAPSRIKDTLGEVISRAGRDQFRCAESEKFAHITFFLNGGTNRVFPGETDKCIPSPKGIPFDQIPELHLEKVAKEVIDAIQEDYDLIVTNFANGDVIGHTANNEAKIKCAQVVDFHLGRVINTAKDAGMAIIITADHGNLEEMITPEGKAHVAHTSNLVPFLMIDTRSDEPLNIEDGSLKDISPTILNVLGIHPPEAMTGNNLVKGHNWGEDRSVLLIILDGWGIGKTDETNPIHRAQTPLWDQLIQDYPIARLTASGEAVGLQPGKAGNSEAGHSTIGAGRLVYQDDVRLDKAMKDGTFYNNEVLLQAIEHVIRKNTNLHLIGLLTEKSSHGSIDYPLALLKMAKEKGLQEVYLHIIFDGRSTPPGSAPVYLEKLEKMISEIGVGQIVGGVGRGIALDRDGNYAKIKRAYEAMVLGIGSQYS